MPTGEDATSKADGWLPTAERFPNGMIAETGHYWFRSEPGGFGIVARVYNARGTAFIYNVMSGGGGYQLKFIAKEYPLAAWGPQIPPPKE
jgi:hypothetical protein